MARRMADSKFRDEQHRQRYDKHIAPINRYVDRLRKSSRAWAPYVAPMYGGVNAKLLSILRDPGPKTQADVGSGFLCMENDDATAEAISELFATARIDAEEIVPWNVYPWYINRAPRTDELQKGVEPLKRIIDLLPKLRVVMLHGVSARAGWRRLIRAFPKLVASRNLHVIETYHTSRQAFWHRDPAVRQARRQHLKRAFSDASRYLRR